MAIALTHSTCSVASMSCNATGGSSGGSSSRLRLAAPMTESDAEATRRDCGASSILMRPRPARLGTTRGGRVGAPLSLARAKTQLWIWSYVKCVQVRVYGAGSQAAECIAMSRVGDVVAVSHCGVAGRLRCCVFALRCRRSCTVRGCWFLFWGNRRLTVVMVPCGN